MYKHTHKRINILVIVWKLLSRLGKENFEDNFTKVRGPMFIPVVLKRNIFMVHVKYEANFGQFCVN